MKGYVPYRVMDIKPFTLEKEEIKKKEVVKEQTF
jgi:hypothetical protein